MRILLKNADEKNKDASAAAAGIMKEVYDEFLKGKVEIEDLYELRDKIAVKHGWNAEPSRKSKKRPNQQNKGSFF